MNVGDVYKLKSGIRTIGPRTINDTHHELTVLHIDPSSSKADMEVTNTITGNQFTFNIGLTELANHFDCVRSGAPAINIGSLYRPKKSFTMGNFMLEKRHEFIVRSINTGFNTISLEVNDPKTGNKVFCIMSPVDVANKLDFVSFANTQTPVSSNNNSNAQTPILKDPFSNAQFNVGDIIECFVDSKLSLGFFRKGEEYKVVRKDIFLGGWVLENTATKSMENILLSEEQHFRTVVPHNMMRVPKLKPLSFCAGDRVRCINQCKDLNGNVINAGTELVIKHYDPIADNFMLVTDYKNALGNSSYIIESKDINNFGKINEEKAEAPIDPGIGFMKVSLELDKTCQHQYELKELQLFTSTVKTLICNKCGEEKQ